MAMFKGLPENQIPESQKSSRAASPKGDAAYYDQLMEDAGSRWGVPAGLMLRLRSKETGGEADPATATSSAGAYGIGQVLPSTARDMGYTDEQMNDPIHQADASAQYLRQMYDRYGNWRDALQAYHDGPGNHDRNLAGTRTPGPEGQQYIDERFDAYTGGGDPAVDTSAPQRATSARRSGMFAGNGGAQQPDAVQQPAEQQAPATEAPQTTQDAPKFSDVLRTGYQPPQPAAAQTAPQNPAEPQQPAMQQPAAPQQPAPVTPEQPAAQQQPQQAAPLFSDVLRTGYQPPAQQQAQQPAAAPQQPAQQPAQQPQRRGMYDNVSGQGIADVAADTFNALGEGAAVAGRALINAGVDIARPIWNWTAESAEAQANSALPAGVPRTVLPRISKDQDKAISGLENMIGAKPGSLHTQGVGEQIASEILPYFVGPGELKVLQKVPGAARFVVNSLIRNAVGSTAQAAKTDDELAEFLKNEAIGLAGDTAFKMLGKAIKPVWERSKAALGFGTKTASKAERDIGKQAEQATDGTAAATTIERPAAADGSAQAPIETNAAIEKLAQGVNLDQKVLYAAEQLGMADKLTPAHYAANRSTREVAAALQSVPESQMGARNAEAIATLANHADDLIHIAGGTSDKVQLSQRFKDESLKAIDDLGKKADEQYSEIRKLIPTGADVNATSTLAHLKDLTDAQRVKLSPMEKQALSRLTPETNEAGQITQRPSYEALDQMRKEVGQAINSKSGPFQTEELGKLKMMYRVLTEDQEAAAASYGASKAWDVGKALVRQQKDLEERYLSVTGKEGLQQATTKYGDAMKKLGKGDVADFDQLIANTPEHMRTQMVATALQDAMTTTAKKGESLSIPTFLNWYEGAQKSGALGRVMAHLDQPSRARLRNIAAVAKGIKRGNELGISTGRVNAFIERFNQGQSPIGRLFGYGTQAAGAAGGWVLGGPLGAAVGAGAARGAKAIKDAATRAQNARVSAADEVLSDPAFLDVVKAAAYRDGQAAASAERIRNGTATAEDLAKEKWIAKAERKLNGSPAWQKLRATLPTTEREDLKRLGISNWLINGMKAEATAPDDNERGTDRQ